jgi:hypothetical protein
MSGETKALHLTGPALRFSEGFRSLQPARQVNAVVTCTRVANPNVGRTVFGFNVERRGVTSMGNLSFNRNLGGTLGFIGGTIGAAGWILGASEELAWAGYVTEASLVLLCAAGVLLTGGIMWCLWLAGRSLNPFVLIQALLGASFTFGVLALYTMRIRGVVAFAIDSSGRYPEGLAYAAPIALLAIMACLWCTPIRKRLHRTRL